ncbi:hypothetical protein C8J57DRAFT_1704690 [Mycena rebaudengoi]|nr:hypothetical protein C8J57DRAFT_1704690 [Mycena rebaudengoi]
MEEDLQFLFVDEAPVEPDYSELHIGNESDDPTHLAQPPTRTPQAPAQHLRAHARARAPPAPWLLRCALLPDAAEAADDADATRCDASFAMTREREMRGLRAGSSFLRGAASPSPAADGGAGEPASPDVGRALDAADDMLPRVPSDPSRARVPTPLEEPATNDIVRVPIDEVRVPIEEIRVPIDDATDEVFVPIDARVELLVPIDDPEFLVLITPEPLAPAPPKDGGSGDRARPDAVLATLRTDGARSRVALLGAAKPLVFALAPPAFTLPGGPIFPSLLFAADLPLEDAEPAVPVLPDALTVPDAPAVPVPDEPAPVKVVFAVAPAHVDAASAAPRPPHQLRRARKEAQAHLPPFLTPAAPSPLCCSSPNPTHTPADTDTAHLPAHGTAPPPRAVRLELPPHRAPPFVVLVLAFLRPSGLAFVLSSESTSAAPSTLTPTPTPSPALAFRFSPPTAILSILANAAACALSKRPGGAGCSPPADFLALPSGRIGRLPKEGTGIAESLKTRRSGSVRVSALVWSVVPPLVPFSPPSAPSTPSTARAGPANPNGVAPPEPKTMSNL